MSENIKNNKNPKINKNSLQTLNYLHCLRVAFRPRLLNSNQRLQMTQELYAIHDNKASFFMTPWPCRNVGIARREFAGACANPETAMGKFPADFVLYHVGEYDDHDASVKSLTLPVRICDGVEILQMAKAENEHAS